MYVKSGRRTATVRSVHRHVTTGVAGAAMVGLGAFVAASIAAEEPTQTSAYSAEIKLVADEQCLPTALIGCGGQSSGTDETFQSLAAGPTALRPMIGDGGWLIGNGLDAAADCERKGSDLLFFTEPSGPAGQQTRKNGPKAPDVGIDRRHAPLNTEPAFSGNAKEPRLNTVARPV